MKYLKKFNEKIYTNNINEYNKVVSDIKEILSQLYLIDGNFKIYERPSSLSSTFFIDVDFRKDVSWDEIKIAVLEVKDYLDYEYPNYNLDFIRLNGTQFEYSEEKDDFIKIYNFTNTDGSPVFVDNIDTSRKNIRELKMYFNRPKNVNESKKEKEDKPKLEFKKKLRKKGAKTDVYDVLKNGKLIGQIKWHSRVMGYGFRPTTDIEPEIKSFIKSLMIERRKSK